MVAPQSRDLAPRVRVAGRGLSPAWVFNRLRCMSAAEIGHRMVRAAAMRAERLGIPACEPPPADLAVEGARWVAGGEDIDPVPYVAAAERVVAGRFDVFALRDTPLGNPPRWNRDPKTGIEAPLEFGMTLDYRDERRVGDCKYLWEPNRHQHLVALAQAWSLTGNARYAETVRAHLESWIEACPFRMGAHWSSALEAGMRLISWSLAWQLLGGVRGILFQGEEGEAFRERWLRSVYQHAEFIAAHFSLHSSANNHLVGEAAGLYIAAVTWPHWPRAAQWRAMAKEILEREALLQNAPDGVNREQAISYQQFTFELLLLCRLAGAAAGDDFSQAYAERLERMLDFLASVIDGGGNVPMIGDADDAQAAPLDPRSGSCRFHSSLATGALVFDRGDLKEKARSLDDKTRWLVGQGARERFAALRAKPRSLPVRCDFPQGGYYILGCDFETADEIRIVADAGPLGYREIAAHGHADALSFTLSLGGVELLVDPGTFAYHTEPEWRAYFRGTSAHNTLRVDGLDQSEPGGNFMWLRKARTERRVWLSTEAQDCLEARHDGYARLADPVMHQRRLALDKRSRTLLVEDLVEADEGHAVELFLHCAEGTRVTPIAGGFRLEREGRAIRVRWPQHPTARVQVLHGSTDPIGGWISRRFDEKQPTHTLVWRADIPATTLLRTFIDC